MPSWNDGETSSEEPLGDLVDMDYAPQTCADSTFAGLAVGAIPCRVHELEPKKCVAFEGTNTGRRFHMCSVENQIYNCGFVRWVDQEWPQTLKNALARLWGMYEDVSNTRIEERVQNGQLVQELVDEKNKLKKNYHSLLDDMDKFIKETEKKAYDDILKKMNEEKNSVFPLSKTDLEAQVMKLNAEVFDLKEEKKQLEEMDKVKSEKWEKEKKELKDEKRKIEHMLFDLLKVSNANKEKLLKIKEVLGEM